MYSGSLIVSESVKVNVISLKFSKVKSTSIQEIARSISPFVKSGDVIAVCSSLISRAEGRVKKLDNYIPSEKAIKIAEMSGEDPRFIQAVIEESDEILVEYPFLLVKSKFGNICVNAGIDRSNVELGKILLPPENPDKSAENLRKALMSDGKMVGIIVTDTNGRCFRKGVVGFAIGCSGFEPMRDWIGKKDLFGNVLKKTFECIVDEFAAFANFMMGEGNASTPVVIFRGVKDLVCIDSKSKGILDSVYRDEEEDIIRKFIKSFCE